MEKNNELPSNNQPWLKYYKPEAQDFVLPKETVYNITRKSNESNLQANALDFFGRKITYEEFFEKVENTAKAFKALGIKEGDVVSFTSITTPEIIYSFYALNKLGAIANMIDPRTNADRILDYINKAESNVLVTLDVAYPKIKKIVNDAKVEKIISVSVSDSLPFGMNIAYNAKNSWEILTKKSTKVERNSKWLSWNDFYSQKDKINKLDDISYKENQPVAIVYTGGTTGIPKGVMLTNENFNAMVLQQIYCETPWQKNDKFLNIMPPFLAYGLVCGLNIPLQVGMEIVIIPKFEVEKFDQYIKKNKPNHLMGVPSFFETMINSKTIQKMDLKFIKSIIVGGDHMKPSVEETINDFLKNHNCFHKVLKGYGMSEMSSNAVYTKNDDCNKPLSVGIPLPGNNAKIINPQTGEELMYNERGEICLTGPTKMLGYFKNEEETKNIIDEAGWVHTGDIGQMSIDGLIYIVDRLKRMIVRPDGHNVFPSNIENILNTHPNVLQSCVVGIKSNQYENGEVPTAFIVLKDQSETNKTIDDLNTISLIQLPERDVAQDYQVVDEIPYTSVGKVDYQKIKNDYVQNKSAGRTLKL